MVVFKLVPELNYKRESVIYYKNLIEKLWRHSFWAHGTAKPVFSRYMSFNSFFEWFRRVEYGLVCCVVEWQFSFFHDQANRALHRCPFLHMCNYMSRKRSHFHPVIDLKSRKEKNFFRRINSILNRSLTRSPQIGHLTDAALLFASRPNRISLVSLLLIVKDGIIKKSINAKEKFYSTT